MSLTFPQIIIWCHAANYNAERSKQKCEWDSKKREEERKEEDSLDAKDPVVWKGKRLSQLTAEEQAHYMSDI